MSRSRHKARASGGRIGADYGGGDSNVAKEAVERKRGGKVDGEGCKSAARCDTKARARGGAVAGRKRGGGVGANSSPLSTAHNASGGGEGSSNPTDTYGGLPK